MKDFFSKSIYFLVIILALGGLISSPIALLFGVIFNFLWEAPFKKSNPKNINLLLKISVVGLGFGMLIKDTLQTGKEGFGLTIVTIVFTITLGLWLTRLLKIDLKLGHLITSGTAICGGSAIAAIAPTVKAQEKTISMALGVIFLLNATALFIFPSLGYFFHLTQEQFGLWCAVAIHDTSSVVGAALSYGDEALQIATTVKLSRTLWIIPFAMFSMFLFKTKGEKIKIPYFILLFLLAIAINSSHILPESTTQFIVLISKRLLVVTLFLIGLTISTKDLKAVGMKPIFLAGTLWVAISVFSLMLIMVKL
ncbi:YeiH family protein [Algivirga pacifica]|uniref:Sulfate exporter family transporter n=1 Tax=Algivirga pacifica TaxID=1162670 RepID=A0ABP9DKB1_9BACT